jgi:cytochrome P450 family 135
MSKNGYIALPPGPAAPASVQTLNWWFRPIQMMERARSRYGPVFSLRLGPGSPVVMVAEPRIGKAVMTGDPEIFRAGDTNGLFRPLMGSNSLLLLDGEEHLRHRRMLLPAFGAGHGRRFADQVREIAEERVSTWEPGQRLTLHDEMEAISFESIMRVVFGADPDDAHEPLRKLVPDMMDRCDSPFALIPWFHRNLAGMSPWARLMKIVDRIDDALYESIRQRRSDPLAEFREDVLSVLVRATQEDGTPVSDRAIRDELLTLIMAGYETTTGALAWSLERLMRTPPAMERLREELRDGKDEYLSAVVKETLRSRPVVPLVARRLLESQRVEGHTFPAGTIVMTSIYLIHHDPDIFPQPYEFRPERFLDGAADETLWIPFGGGTRRCLGAAFAQAEMKVVLSEVLTRTQLEPVGRKPEDYKRKRFTFSPDHGAAARVADSQPATRPLGRRRFRTPVSQRGSVRT